MTNRDKKITADLLEAAHKAIAYFNMKAQRQILGLSDSDDQLRQELCNAVSAAEGKIYCGNLQRIHEAKYAIQLVDQIKD